MRKFRRYLYPSQVEVSAYLISYHYYWDPIESDPNLIIRRTGGDWGIDFSAGIFVVAQNSEDQFVGSLH